MAADLHLHIVKNKNVEKHVKQYLRKTYSSSSTTKKNGWVNICERVKYDGKWMSYEDAYEQPHFTKKKIQKRREIILKYNERIVDLTPNIWIGEVSWLKAALFGDAKTFIPSTVQVVQDIVGYKKLNKITKNFIKKIMKAFDLKNKTGYELASPKDVEKFLFKHLGRKIFTISW